MGVSQLIPRGPLFLHSRNKLTGHLEVALRARLTHCKSICRFLILQTLSENVGCTNSINLSNMIKECMRPMSRGQLLSRRHY